MKKLLIIASILFSTQAFAQQGNWYLGGVGGFGSNTHKDYSGPTMVKTVNSSWAFGPEFGTFLKDDIQLGFVVGLGGGTQKVDGTKTDSRTDFNPTIYCRKFFTVTDNFSVFAGLYLNYLSSTNKNYLPTETKSTSTGFGSRLGLGIAYALSPRFTAVGQYGLFGFTSTTDKDNNGNKTDQNSGFDFGVNTIGAGSFTQGNGSGSVFNIGLYYTIIQK